MSNSEFKNVDAQVLATSDGANYCGGFKACKDRQFDSKQADCQECADDMQDAILQAEKEFESK